MMVHGLSKSRNYSKFFVVLLIFFTTTSFSVEKYSDFETYCPKNKEKVTLALVYNMSDCLKCFMLANRVFEEIINYPEKLDINPIGIFKCFRISELNVYEEQLSWKYDMIVYPRSSDKIKLKDNTVLLVLDKNCNVVESIDYNELEGDVSKSTARLIYAIKQSLGMY